MTFEFVIVYQQEDSVNIQDILLERLRVVLADNLNEIDDDLIDGMLNLKFERRGDSISDDAGIRRTRAVVGCTLELPEDTVSIRAVIDEFSDALIGAPIDHVVKFEDPLLHQELAAHAEELFALEMKLRRVITVIYLNAYPDEPYNLLREETERPMQQPSETQMHEVAENEFFFLTFGQYLNLNRRPDMRQLPALASLIRSNESYESFRRELLRQPVEDEDDAVFLAGLRERMNSIDAMRNCVAHNRRPSKRVTNNYLNALHQLNAMLDQFLNRWELPWGSESEMMWDFAAREAVEEALRGATWDEETKTITLFDPDEEHMRYEVTSREELLEHLRDLAATVFYNYAPRDSGESVFECDEEGIVNNALSSYNNRLETFF